MYSVSAAEALDEFDRWCRARGTGRPCSTVDLLDGVDALIGVLVEQRIEHGRAVSPYFVNTSRLRTLSARSLRVRGGWSKATWQIRSKASMSAADAVLERFDQHALFEQLVDDRLLAVGLVPPLHEVVE